MNIRIFSFRVFSSQFNLNNTDGVATNRRTPTTIISIDKIINTFISSPFYNLFYFKKFFIQLPFKTLPSGNVKVPFPFALPFLNLPVYSRSVRTKDPYSFYNPINNIYYINQNTVKHKH